MNFDTEQKYKEQGYDFMIGIDEAGRGPLAGPVVAAAIMLSRHFQLAPHQTEGFSAGFSNPDYQASKQNKFAIGQTKSKFKNSKVKTLLDVKDSKKITPKSREKIFKLLTQNTDIKYGIGIVSEKIIDKENILQATLMAMKMAVENLMEKNLQINPQNSVILIDGKDVIENLDFDQHSIINGDNKVWSIAAASIIAKVTRDRIMGEYHKKYPQYCFDRHKGYGTKLHFEMIAKHGPCEIHRKSFLS